MKRITLNQIFRAFEMMNRCRQHGEGEGGGASGGSIADPNIVENPVKVEKIDFDPLTYMGDEKVNPAQRPLKDFDRKGKTKEDIDRMIKTAGPSIFLSDEGVAKKKAEKEAKEKERKEKEAKGEFEAKAKVVYKKDAEAEDQKAVVEKVNEDGTYDIKIGDEVIKNVTKEALSATKAKEDEKGIDTDDEEVKAFYKESGLTPDEFNYLSETAQNNLVEKIFAKSGEEDASLQEEHAQLKADYDTLLEDPVIAARVQDITSGSNYVAAKLDPITDQEITEIDNALDGDKPYDAVRKIVQKIIDKRAETAVKKERSLHDLKDKASREMEAAFKVFKKVGELDKRLAVKETDYRKLKKGHKEFDPNKGLGEFATYLTKRGYSAKQIAEHTAEELYKAFAANKGWDKERDKTISKNSKADLLKKLKNPRLIDKAKSLNQGKKIAISGSPTGASDVDYKTLKEELVSGKSDNFTRLLRVYQYDKKTFGLLKQIQFDALKEKESRKKEE